VNKETIILIGMAGCGKSTTGAALATALGYQFIDLDQYIRQQDKQSISEIINMHGEQALLRLEETRMREIDLHRRVIAPGGSIIYQNDLMGYLKQSCILIFLNVSYERIEQRVKNASQRGIVGLHGRTLREIYDQRQPLYSRFADITIYPEDKSVPEVVQEILNQLHDLFDNVP
jgi:shikimate kinase